MRRPRAVPLLLSCCVVSVIAACSDRQETTSSDPEYSSSPSSASPPSGGRPCNDAVVPDSHLPVKLSRQGMKAVGEDGVWFIAPRTNKWGDLLERRGTGRGGK